MTLSYCVFRRGWVSAIDLCSRAFGDPYLLAVGQDLESDARRLAILGVRIGDVGAMDRRLLGDDAPPLLRGLLLVTLDEVDPTHQRAPFVRAHLDHLAGAAAVAPRQHNNLVALADLGGHHSTSGASEM